MIIIIDWASRYGFNGKEADEQVKGSGNFYDSAARLYDPSLVRWLAVDPLATGQFKGRINPVNRDPYPYSGYALDGTNKVIRMYSSKSGIPHLTMVPNVISIIGVHE